jgi:hypothetical protein
MWSGVLEFSGYVQAITSVGYCTNPVSSIEFSLDKVLLLL